MNALADLVKGRNILCARIGGDQPIDLDTIETPLLEEFDLASAGDDLPFTDERFGAVVTTESAVERGGVTLIREFGRVLSDGGVLLVLGREYSGADDLAGVLASLDVVHQSFPITALQMGADGVAIVGHKQALTDSGAAPSEFTPTDLRPFDELVNDQHAQLQQQRTVLEAQAEQLGAQAEQLGAQAELLKRQNEYIEEQSRAYEREADELRRTREALLGAERDVARIHDLEYELFETLALANQLRDADARAAHADARAALAEAERDEARHERAALEGERNEWFAAYSVLATSTSWKMTGPLRTLTAQLRRLARR